MRCEKPVSLFENLFFLTLSWLHLTENQFRRRHSGRFLRFLFWNLRSDLYLWFYLTLITCAYSSIILRIIRFQVYKYPKTIGNCKKWQSFMIQKNTANLWPTFWFNSLRSISQTFQIPKALKMLTFRMRFLIIVHCGAPTSLGIRSKVTNWKKI